MKAQVVRITMNDGSLKRCGGRVSFRWGLRGRVTPGRSVGAQMEEGGGGDPGLRQAPGN